MRKNPCISTVANLLDSAESNSALAPIFFDRYVSLNSENERSAFVIALIGEILLARASNARNDLPKGEEKPGSVMPGFPKLEPD